MSRQLGLQRLTACEEESSMQGPVEDTEKENLKPSRVRIRIHAISLRGHPT